MADPIRATVADLLARLARLEAAVYGKDVPAPPKPKKAKKGA